MGGSDNPKARHTNTHTFISFFTATEHDSLEFHSPKNNLLVHMQTSLSRSTRCIVSVFNYNVIYTIFLYYVLNAIRNALWLFPFFLPIHTKYTAKRIQITYS